MTSRLGKREKYQLLDPIKLEWARKEDKYLPATAAKEILEQMLELKIENFATKVLLRRWENYLRPDLTQKKSPSQI